MYIYIYNAHGQATKNGYIPFLDGYIPFLDGYIPFLDGYIPFLDGYIPFLETTNMSRRT
jgi:hypothetical protein